MKQSNSQHNINPENKDKKTVEEYFSSLKNEDYSGSFHSVESWIRKISIQKQNQKQERNFIKMKNYIWAHKMRLVYTVIALVVVVGACSIPVTQNEPIGNVISWTIPPGVQTDRINSLPWVNKSNLSISENNNNGKIEDIYTLMLPGSTNEQVQSYSRDLEKIKEITSIKTFPLNENVKRPIYAAALNSFFRININASKMSDEELSKEIERQLNEQGIHPVMVDFKGDGNGKRNIRIVLDSTDRTPRDFELRIDQGGNKEQVLKEKVKTGDPDRFKGKTDDEIKQLIKSELDNPNIKDSDIKIMRDEKGNVKVKVEVEDRK